MGWCKQCGVFVKGWKLEKQDEFNRVIGNTNGWTYKKICRECFANQRKNVDGTRKPNTIIVREYYADIVIKDRLGRITLVKIDIEDVERVRKHRWTVKDSDNYIISYSGGGLQRLIMNAGTGSYVTFRNNNPKDCRKENLLKCGDDIEF